MAYLRTFMPDCDDIVDLVDYFDAMNVTGIGSQSLFAVSSRRQQRSAYSPSSTSSARHVSIGKVEPQQSIMSGDLRANKLL